MSSILPSDEYGWKHPLYKTWERMLDRCTNPDAENYHNYGGIGVCVYEEWHKFPPFGKWIDGNLGPRPEGRTLDRYPNRHGNYEPGNLRWATKQEQMSNRRDNWLLLYEGELLTVSEIARRTGVSNNTLRKRLIEYSCNLELALNPPRQKTLSEIAAEHDAPLWAVRKRLAQGETLAEALSPRSSLAHARPHLYRGSYYSIRELAQLAGLAPGTINYRIKVLGLSVEDAVKRAKHDFDYK